MPNREENLSLEHTYIAEDDFFIPNEYQDEDAAEALFRSISNVQQHEVTHKNGRTLHQEEKNLLDARTELLSGAETRQREADAQLSRVRSDFVKNVEAERVKAERLKALAQTSTFRAQTRYISGVETDKTRAEAVKATVQSTYIAGVESDKTRAETRKLRAATFAEYFKIIFIVVVFLYVALAIRY